MTFCCHRPGWYRYLQCNRNFRMARAKCVTIEVDLARTNFLPTGMPIPMPDLPNLEPMSHEPKLTRELRALLKAQRVAALGTIDEAGAPFVSMVPFAIEPQIHCLVIHVSGLAAHTRNLQARDRVSLMVMRSEVAGESVHGQTDACHI